MSSPAEENAGSCGLSSKRVGGGVGDAGVVCNTAVVGDADATVRVVTGEDSEARSGISIATCDRSAACSSIVDAI